MTYKFKVGDKVYYQGKEATIIFASANYPEKYRVPEGEKLHHNAAKEAFYILDIYPRREIEERLLSPFVAKLICKNCKKVRQNDAYGSLCEDCYTMGL